MEPDNKDERIREVELRLGALFEERLNLHKKCDAEHDPKVRAYYWTKIATLDDAIQKCRTELVTRRNIIH
jgi:hypothetical protein